MPATMDVQVIDDDEVVITYSGLLDPYGDAIEDVVIRVQSYEDTPNFQLGLEIVADSRVMANMCTAEDISLEFTSIPNPFLKCGCDEDECDLDDEWDDEDDEEECEHCEVCLEEEIECCLCGFEPEPICEQEWHCCMTENHPCCNCGDYAEEEDMEEEEFCDHCSDYYDDAECCWCGKYGPWRRF